MRLFRSIRKATRDIAPEEIFLDSTNLPAHDTHGLESHVERPVPLSALFAVGAFFLGVALLFGARAYDLQIMRGAAFAQASRENTLERSIIFATRGVIYDRTGKELAWNELSQSATATPFALRKYDPRSGFAHVIGWLRYPRRDAAGAWWREAYTARAGGELSLDQQLSWRNGSTMVETDARGRVERENIVDPARSGTDVYLSIDADVQAELYRILSAHARKQRFTGGAAVIMDVRTGELLALTSFPEYDHAAFTAGDSDTVGRQYADAATPVLDRAVSGLYAPGSIVKPIFAVAALHEGIITPEKTIVSTGAISVPNPYDPGHPTLFRDWTVHGAVDMRTAIAVSSDEYFYTIGGGYSSQEGLGIERLDKYARMFGLSEKTGIALPGEEEGVIPTPAWKSITFGPDDPWRIGDTYHTAIGQYGFQITPIQAVRFTAAIANGGKLLTPQLVASSSPQFTQLEISDANLQVAREGMRLAVTSTRKDATVKALYIASIKIAGKTGTAQIGTRNQWMNSWSVGFWPADNPRYAYAVVLEHAPAGTLSGASPALAPFFQWLIANRPEYIE